MLRRDLHGRLSRNGFLLGRRDVLDDLSRIDFVHDRRDLLDGGGRSLGMTSSARPARPTQTASVWNDLVGDRQRPAPMASSRNDFGLRPACLLDGLGRNEPRRFDRYDVCSIASAGTTSSWIVRDLLYVLGRTDLVLDLLHELGYLRSIDRLDVFGESLTSSVACAIGSADTSFMAIYSGLRIEVGGEEEPPLILSVELVFVSAFLNFPRISMQAMPSDAGPARLSGRAQEAGRARSVARPGGVAFLSSCRTACRPTPTKHPEHAIGRFGRCDRRVQIRGRFYGYLRSGTR